MKKLTKGQRFALAREARRLAMECVEGTAPYLNAGSYDTCAVGEVVRRAGLRTPEHPSILPSEIEHEAFGVWSSMDPNAIVSRGLARRGRAGVVFPLLALATALDGKDI